MRRRHLGRPAAAASCPVCSGSPVLCNLSASIPSFCILSFLSSPPTGEQKEEIIYPTARLNELSDWIVFYAFAALRTLLKRLYHGGSDGDCGGGGGGGPLTLRFASCGRSAPWRLFKYANDDPLGARGGRFDSHTTRPLHAPSSIGLLLVPLVR